MSDFFKSFLISPGYWPFLLALIPIAVLISVIYFRSIQAVRIWFDARDYDLFVPGLKVFFRGFAVLMLLLALVGPYWGRLEQEISIRGREVYFLMDVSASMNCEDIQPSRIGKVKKEVRKMISQLKGDKVGLIVFTSDAYVQCPLTSDLNAALLFLDMVGTAQFSNTGTSFRSALLMALDRFINTEATEKKTSRSIVLISDGEDFGENYASVVTRLKDANVTVFTVGVGSYQGAQVPNMIKGQKMGFKKNQDGSPAISHLKDESLKEIASSFGTSYTPIDDQIDNLDPVLDQVKMLSSVELDRERRLSVINRYQWFLGAAMFFFVMSMVWLPVSTSKRSGMKGRT